MSGHHLAVVVATRGGTPNTTPAPPPFNILFVGGVLGGIVAAVCAAYYCCGWANCTRKSRDNSQAGNIYTLSTDCPHGYGLYPETPNDGYLPFRRPPTPGPPPAYDSVVSSTDKLRRFGIVDDYVEDISKFDRYILREGSTGPEELRDTVITMDDGRLDDLNFCTIRRGCMDRFERSSETGSEQNVFEENPSRGSSEEVSEEKTHNSEGSVSEVVEMDEIADFVSETSACQDESSNDKIPDMARVGILKQNLFKDDGNVEDSSLPTYEVAISIAESYKGSK